MSIPLPTTPDLIACILHLDSQHAATLERTQGHRAHGLFMDLMRRSDPALATLLHQQAPVKPFTVAPLQDETRRLRAGSSYLLRITLLRGELFPTFAGIFLRQPGTPIPLGEADFSVREVLVTPGSHRWAGLDSWARLLDEAEPATGLYFQFVTPAAFSLGSDTHGRKRVGLFPDPEHLFGSLLRRWNQLAPMQLPEDLLKRVGILVSRYELSTEMLSFSKSPQLGFTGRCWYKLDGDDASLRMLHALASAAFFLGVGYKTTQGMGMARAQAC